MLFGTNLVKYTYMRYVHYPGAFAPYALACIIIYTYVAVLTCFLPFEVFLHTFIVQSI